MKILVPIKRVVDYNVKVRPMPDNSNVDLNNAKMSVNPFCEIALEEAVRIKEAGNAEEVIAITVGKTESQEQLRTALALGGGGAAKANTDISGNVNLSRGAVAAKTTDAKVKSAVSKAIDNPGQSYSASSEKGRMRTTVSGGINVSGRIGGGGDKNNNKEKKQRQK